MIITCPQCSARYKVKDGLVTEKGKKVRCKKCGAVFVAYPGERSKLIAQGSESTTQAKPDAKTVADQTQRPVPTPPPAQTPVVEQPTVSVPQTSAASPEVGPQATVKVDRSKLENYLTQQQDHIDDDEPLEKTLPGTMPSQFESGSNDQDEGGAAQATVQIDRTQIDAFIRQAQTGDDQAPAPEATVQVDRSQLDQFLQQQSTPQQATPEPATPEPAAPQPAAPQPAAPQPPQLSFDADAPPQNPAETVRMDALFSTPPAAPPQDEETAVTQHDPEATDEAARADVKAPPAPTLDIGDEPSSEPDSMALPGFDDSLDRKEDMAFPSDDELGIKDMPEPTQPDLNFEPEPPSEPANIPPAPKPTGERVYEAKVDGRVYPNLTLISISRWISEGRLLEDDEINDGSGFRRADDFEEIRPFFDSFHASRPQSEEAPEERKGFFAKLFSAFKR